MGGIGTADVVLLGILGLVAYFIGNISPSTIMAKRQGIDIKKEGSGNAGTTNALRVMGKKAGCRVKVKVSDSYSYEIEIRSIEKGSDDDSIPISSF